MESTGIPGKIQVSRDTYAYLYDKYAFKERELENVKGVGNIKAYIFESRKVPKSETVNIENTTFEQKSKNLVQQNTISKSETVNVENTVIETKNQNSNIITKSEIVP